MTHINFQNYKSEGLLKFFIVGTVIFGFVSIILHHLLEKIPDFFKWILLFTDALTVPTLFFISFTFVEKKGWKMKLFHFLVDVPNMNGRYEGILISSYVENGNAKEMKCVFEIYQTASTINISGYFRDPENKEKNSSSISSLEKIIKKGNGFFELYYNFSNVNATLEDLLKGHQGTGRFDFFPDTMQLKGEYYNVKGNSGKITVAKISDTLLGRFN